MPAAQHSATATPAADRRRQAVYASELLQHLQEGIEVLVVRVIGGREHLATSMVVLAHASGEQADASVRAEGVAHGVEVQREMIRVAGENVNDPRRLTNLALHMAGGAEILDDRSFNLLVEIGLCLLEWSLRWCWWRR